MLPIVLSSQPGTMIDRKSTRLNFSHLVISYAVFCLKKFSDVYHHQFTVAPCKASSNRTIGSSKQGGYGHKLTVRHVHDHFFFNDTATTEIYTLSLHDALPI